MTFGSSLTLAPDLFADRLSVKRGHFGYEIPSESTCAYLDESSAYLQGTVAVRPGHGSTTCLSRGGGYHVVDSQFEYDFVQRYFGQGCLAQPSVSEAVWIEVLRCSRSETARQATRYVYNRVLDFVEAEQFETLNELLAQVNPQEIPIEVSLGFLSITLEIASKVPMRAFLRSRARAHFLTLRSDWEVVRLLEGL